MEVSAFSDLIQGNGHCLAFSALTGKACAVSERVRTALVRQDLPGLSLREVARLYRMGVLVTSRSAERQYALEQLEAYRESSDALRYTLLTTYACNLRCKYCYEDAIESPRGTMKRDVAEAVLAMIRRDLTASDASSIGITLYGGEPLLNLKSGLYVLRKLREQESQAGYTLVGAIISNGTLFDKQNTAALAPYIQYAQITFDGGPDFHDSIRFTRGREPTFDRICDSINLLINQGIRVMIRIQVCSQSIASLEGCFARLKQHGLLHHKLTRCYFFPILDIRGVCSARSFQCGREYFEPELFEQLWGYGQKYGAMVTTPPVPVWVAPYCSFANRWACLIDPEGRLYKCVAEVGREDCVIGTVWDERRGQTEQQQECERRFAAHRGMSFEKCSDCAYLPLCDGGCAHLARYGIDGNGDAPSCELHLRPFRAWLKRESDSKPFSR